MVHWFLPVQVYLGWDAKCLVSKETWGFLCPSLSPFIILRTLRSGSVGSRGAKMGICVGVEATARGEERGVEILVMEMERY